MEKNKKKMKGRLLQYLVWPVYFTVAVAAVNAIVFFVNRTSGLVVLPLTVSCAAGAGLLYGYQRRRIYQDILDMTVDHAQIQNTILKRLPVPYGILDENGRILWGNERLEALLKADKNSRHPVWELIPELKEKDYPPQEGRLIRQIRLGDEYFRLEIDNVPVSEEMVSVDILGLRNDQGGLYTLYLFDETEQVLFAREREDEKLVVGLIYLDNYDEVLESIEEVRRSLLVALIDRKINRYVIRMNGFIKKLEKDKYLVLIKKRCLTGMKEDKFALLEDVKTVSIGNDMSVTISIGLGLGGDSYSKNYDYARAAIDMALGRGGDQAVIKEKDSITYYGGKSQRVEKNTRVKARVKAHALRELIENSEKILIMGHRIGDVDSFGAGVGIHRIAATLGKRSYIVADTIEPLLRPMLERVQANLETEEPFIISCEKAVEMVDALTLIVVVDVNRPSYTECPAILTKGSNIVVLDHHRQMTERLENAVLSYVEPYASSTCELVAEILQYVDEEVRISSSEADLMYAGIVVDTNSFVSKAGVRTFEAAAFLRRNGADVVRVRKMLRDNMDDYKARAAAVSQAEIFEKYYAISVCPAEGLDSPTVVGAQAANELLNIVGVKASFVLTEYNNVIYISARSIDEVNVQVIMEKFGGGGHMTIAGAQLKDCTIGEAKDLLRQTVSKMIEEGDI
ncbi:MAG: DHH family phosphoesterase [Lachnospiraceae bacterium]|jgi:c-di-AMP phosphodiesterase-like protein|nr:DHH family phosphoesterase [Lachnospiraceae bacterium]